MSVVQVRPFHLCGKCQPLGIEDTSFTGNIRFRFVEMNDLCYGCARNSLLITRIVDHATEHNVVEQVQTRSAWHASFQDESRLSDV